VDSFLLEKTTSLNALVQYQKKFLINCFFVVFAQQPEKNQKIFNTLLTSF